MSRLPVFAEPLVAEDLPTILPGAAVGATAMVSTTFFVGLLGASSAVASAMSFGVVSIGSMAGLLAVFILTSCVADGLNLVRKVD